MEGVPRAAQPPGPRARRPRPGGGRACGPVRAQRARGDPGLGRSPGDRPHPGAGEPPPHRRRGGLHPRRFRCRRGLRRRRLPSRAGAGAGTSAAAAARHPPRRLPPALGAPPGRPSRVRPARARRAAGRAGRLDGLHRRDDRPAQGRPAAGERSVRGAAAAGGAPLRGARRRAPGGGAALPLRTGRLRALRAHAGADGRRHAEVRRRGGAARDRPPSLHDDVHGADAAQAPGRPACGRPRAPRRVLDALDRGGQRRRVRCG